MARLSTHAPPPELSRASPRSRDEEIAALEQKLESLELTRPVLTAEAEDTLRTPLTDEQEELVRDALSHGHPHSEVLVSSAFKSTRLAPPQSAPSHSSPAMGELELTRKHMECMHEGVWLNDEVINFYLGLLQERENLAAGGKQPRVHFHNTFFYNKLYSGQREYSFKAISRCAERLRLAAAAHCTQVDDGEAAGLPHHGLRAHSGARAPRDALGAGGDQPQGAHRLLPGLTQGPRQRLPGALGACVAAAAA